MNGKSNLMACPYYILPVSLSFSLQACPEPSSQSFTFITIPATTPELSPGEGEGEGEGEEHEEDDKNDRNGVPSSVAAQLRLDMFFPFDPYLLRKSGHYIKGNYLAWKGSQNKDEDEHDEDVEV